MIGTVSMTPPAVCRSQYWPVFGGFLGRSMAKPWSPARIDLIPIQLFGFCVAGFVIGGAVGLLSSVARR